MGLTKEQLHHFELLLKNIQNELLIASETGDEAEDVVELDQTRMGRLSRMDAMQAQAMSVETGRRRRQDLIAIEAALVRITEDDYGDCFECGEVINPNRLEANPIATLCINCAEALE